MADDQRVPRHIEHGVIDLGEQNTSSCRVLGEDVRAQMWFIL